MILTRADLKLKTHCHHLQTAAPRLLKVERLAHTNSHQDLACQYTRSALEEAHGHLPRPL